jgi:hypothetical protein
MKEDKPNLFLNIACLSLAFIIAGVSLGALSLPILIIGMVVAACTNSRRIRWAALSASVGNSLIVLFSVLWQKFSA